jgi:hypothetical protein
MRKEIWYVIGEDENKNYSLLPTFFETKILAEAYARALFPEESEDKRYARIRFAKVEQEF